MADEEEFDAKDLTLQQLTESLGKKLEAMRIPLTVLHMMLKTKKKELIYEATKDILPGLVAELLGTQGLLLLFLRRDLMARIKDTPALAQLKVDDYMTTVLK